MADLDVSFVIPTLNRPGLLREALQSVLSQAPRPRQIIVVDNATNTEAEAAVRSMGPRITYLRSQPTGVQIARNLGGLHATSEWIAYLDDDDLLLPSYLATASHAMSDNRVDIIGTDHIKFQDGVSDSLSNFDMAPPGYWDGVRRPDGDSDWSFVGKFPIDRLMRRIPIYPSAMIIRRTHVKSIGGWDPRLPPRTPEDIEFLVRALSAGNLALVWKPLVLYRRHAGAATAGAFHQRMGRRTVFKYISRTNKTAGPPFHRALRRHLRRTRAGLFDTVWEHRALGFVRRHTELFRTAMKKLGSWNRS